MGRLTLDLRDFGPVSQVDNMEIRDLTIFVGPNGSGKSFVAMLLYALDRAVRRTFDGLISRVEEPWLVPESPLFRIEASTPPATVERALGEFAVGLGTRRTISEFASLVSLARTAALDDRVGGLLAKSLETAVAQQLEGTFGAPCADLVRQGSSAAHISLRCDGEPLFSVDIDGAGTVAANVPLDIANLITSGKNLQRLEPLLGELEWVTHMLGKPAVRKGRGRLPPKEVMWQRMQMLLSQFIVALVRDRFAACWPGAGETSRSYYLPASRAGFVASQKLIALAYRELGKRAGAERLPEVPPLPGPATDFLNELLQLTGKPGNGSGSGGSHSPARQLTNVFEGEILHGTMKVDAKGPGGIPEIQFVDERFPAMAFSSHRVHSGAGELAPIFLFIKSRVRPGDCLVIEEPEAHLHPGLLLPMAKVLAGLANSKVRVLVTSHSDFLLTAFNALLAASQLDAKSRARLPVGPPLAPKTVSVVKYSRGGTACQMQIGDGIPADEFEQVVESLYDLKARTENLIHKRRGGKRS